MYGRNHKYNAIKTAIDGYYFASKGEAECYVMLKLLLRAGEITFIKCQPGAIRLGDIGIAYRPDFLIHDKDGSTIAVEFKGVETATWRIKRKAWMHAGPYPLRVYKKIRGRVTMTEEIIPEKLQKKEGQEKPKTPTWAIGGCF